MHPLGIRLEITDPPRLGPEIINGLKGILGFNQAVFHPYRGKGGLVGILEEIRMSARQKERAEKRLVAGLGFWDRVGQKALVPIFGEDRSRPLGLYEFSGVPKDIAPGEATRTLQLVAAVIHDRLLLSKISRTMSAGELPPAYISDIKRDRGTRSLYLLQLSFHRTTPTLKRGIEIIRQAFRGCRVEPAGRSCSTLWFTLDSRDANQLSAGIRQAALLLSRSRQSFKALIGHVLSGEMDQILHTQHVARGLGTAVLAPSMLYEILEKTGADLASPVFREGGFRASRSSCCMMVRFESLASGHKIGDFCRQHVSNCRVLEAGNRCLVLHFKGHKAGKGKTGLQGLARDIFRGIQKKTGARVTAGFAWAAQPGISPSSLPYASLLALIHAELLGIGNMAVFDHVTLNVQGDLLVSWGDVRGACSAYRRGLRLKPGDTNLLNSLGVCLADLRRFKQARTCFQEVLASRPDNFMALYNLSGVNLDTGNLEEAEKEAEKAYGMDPRNHAVLLRLVTCWLRQKKVEKINALWAEMSRHETLPVPLLRTFGRAALETGDWHEAKRILTRCLDLKKNDPLCLGLLARGFYLLENDTKTAKKLLAQIPEDALNLRELREITADIGAAGSP